jgi:hypothetical protein
MEFVHKDCLHCTILQEVGRRLENGQIDGQGALDDLVLVMAEIMAAAPTEDADELMNTVEQDLMDAVARARQRTLRESAAVLSGGRRREIARRVLTPEREGGTGRFQ